MADMEIKGLNELVNKLREIGAGTEVIEKEALNVGAKIVASEASQRAPRSNLPKKHLADNIKISKVKTKEGIKVVEIGPQKGDNDEFYYGKFLEFGTSKMSAHPFMEPAIETKKSEIERAMSEVIKRGLNI